MKSHKVACFEAPVANGSWGWLLCSWAIICLALGFLGGINCKGNLFYGLNKKACFRVWEEKAGSKD